MDETQSKPMKVDVVSPAEFFGKLVYNYIIEVGGSIPDVTVLPHELQITPEQLKLALLWCTENEMLDIVVY